MWTHRLSRIVASCLAAQIIACAAQPSPPPRSSAAAASATPLATSVPSAQPSSEALPVESDDPVWGSPTAPVTLLEFSDLQCPFCSRVNPTIKGLQAKYGPNQLRIVFKHNPLSFHEYALPAAKVADAVLRQGGSAAFFKFIDLAFEQQLKLSDEALPAWVAQIGLDPKAVLARAELPATTEKVARDAALAAKIGASGTPAFRINGITLTGAQPTSEFTELIDAELKAAAALEQQGTAPAAIYAARVALNFKPPALRAEAEDDDDADLSIWRVPIQGAPVIGPADALVTIVEFFDYQCPYCRRAEATMDELLARYPKDLRIVLRQNPLPFHPHALPAANLALEARAEKGSAGFLEANRALFSDKFAGLAEADLLALAKELKLDETRVKAALAKNTHAAEIDADVDLAQDLKAAGTPYFFINGQRLVGAQPIENFVTAIDAQLKVASALVANGTPRASVYDEIMKHGKEPEPPAQKSLPAPSSDNPARGPLNAKVVIHEFADFQCPFCGRVEATLKELERTFPNQLRFVWHDLPLPFHGRARPAAIVAREARAEKGDAGFWKIHDLMFADQGVAGALSESSLDQYARELGLDAKRLNEAKSDGRFDAVLARDQALGSAAGINGTPAFVINGYYLSGAQPLSSFKRMVRYALAHPATAAPAPVAAPPKP